MSQQDKSSVLIDQVYRHQEVELSENKMRIEALCSQVDELCWLNSVSEKKLTEQLDKYAKKKLKSKREKLKMQTEYSDMEMKFED